ncbi:F-box only protein 32 [Pseudolycoriella hygida]|uniref:F-box only protein 32 n=1 Tax=Pseudolycoriella hygida TaxID=35572 RepID=A0A9Q0S8R8_9DIPT|nr:F-box only protein 32 [Pseudolycoriella hygida]
MPFISKDWRSPGEAWVKTEDGWEKLKVLECGKRKRCSSECSNSSEICDSENWASSTDITETEVPPHCHITIRCTREIAGFNGLGEAVKRLDFRSSVRDRRRFQYICALLRLLVAGKGIASLPGSAQRLLLQMLEEVASHVCEQQQNINILRGLAMQLQKIVRQENQKCWGKPLGSQSLWNGHVQTIKRIQDMASHVTINEPGPEVRPKLHELPEECIREIILRISDYHDLESSSAAWSLMAALVSEQRVWRELAQFHFTQEQIDLIVVKKFSNVERKDYQKIFHELRRKYGIRDDHQYAEVLVLCRFCCCLFWPSAGHPCIADQSPDFRARLKGTGTEIDAQPVPPAQFLKYFSL